MRRKGLRRLKTAVAVAALVGMLGFDGGATVAADFDYYGQLDSFTGERVADAEGTSEMQTASNNVWLSETMYYDLEKRLYGYPAGTATVYATVADGMLVRDRVTISLPDGLPVTVYKDGTELAFTGGELSERGSYTVHAADGGQVGRLFEFTILSHDTNQIAGYNMPDGFRITGATRNGDEINWSMGFVDMSEEGDYSVDYECSRTQIKYNLNVTVDTTPPEITLVGVDEDGKARGPVTITDKGEYDTLAITKDGEPYTLLMTYTFTQSGRYVVTVIDEAGNISNYPFTIMIYLDRNGWIFVLLFVAVIFGAVVYVHYHRTHLRIR